MSSARNNETTRTEARNLIAQSMKSWPTASTDSHLIYTARAIRAADPTIKPFMAESIAFEALVQISKGGA